MLTDFMRRLMRRSIRSAEANKSARIEPVNHHPISCSTAAATPGIRDSSKNCPMICIPIGRPCVLPARHRHPRARQQDRPGKSGTKSRELVEAYGYTAHIRSRGEGITKKSRIFPDRLLTNISGFCASTTIRAERSRSYQAAVGTSASHIPASYQSQRRLHTRRWGGYCS